MTAAARQTPAAVAISVRMPARVAPMVACSIVSARRLRAPLAPNNNAWSAEMDGDKAAEVLSRAGRTFAAPPDATVVTILIAAAITAGSCVTKAADDTAARSFILTLFGPVLRVAAAARWSATRVTTAMATECVRLACMRGLRQERGRSEGTNNGRRDLLVAVIAHGTHISTLTRGECV
eukprot:CAMPEP_0198704814 /NCGR_PEP_ID=MMETSP1468-20131203/390102_1 /TAXON_ID=1461545 /ORGANISM="Mantoniella sp, Strain CCMP1436" /LENGTH=178 /DNA_ID=CAMNT_0044463649 /DNA_START=1216 /DNA_END=1751 /DNA_ORIENTATION=+